LGKISKGENKIIWNRKKEVNKKMVTDKEFRDSVYIENLTNMYIELERINGEIRESNSYLSREMSNMQGIFEREKVNLKTCLTAEVAKHILDLSDHMSRIHNAAEKTNNLAAILEGMSMIGAEMDKVLGSLGIQKQEPIGKVYDPNLFELGGMKMMEGIGNNVIVEVLREGFVCNNRVIRPALVLVNVKKEEQPTTI
jgi:molecular chaperone GrpE (heat shock protein)